QTRNARARVRAARSDLSRSVRPLPPVEVSCRLSLFGSRPLWCAAAIGFLALAALGFLPLFGGPGYEAALAAGLLLPSLAALATALTVAGSRPAEVRLSGRAALGFGVAAGVSLGLMAVGISLLHGARVGYCDVSGGVLLMLLGPGFGAVMGGAWGT